MRETRLYYKGAHQQAYERFETVRLAADEALLKRFVFLLGAERVVPVLRSSAAEGSKKEEGRMLSNRDARVVKSWGGESRMADKMPGGAAQTAHPVSRVRFIAPRQPTDKADGATRYSRFVTCYPCLSIRVPCFGRSWTIWKHKEARPRPRRRNPEPGAHPQRPRQPSLRPDPGGDRPDVANRPAPHAHSAARDHPADCLPRDGGISSPACGMLIRCAPPGLSEP